MRKRIALFANGWGYEYLKDIGRGVLRCAGESDVDVFAFVNYSTHTTTPEDRKGEFDILTLPDLKDFDGVILLTNSFNIQQEIDYLSKKVEEAAIPAISLECELEGMDYIGTDNYSGMHELAEHIIRDHGAAKILFVGGFKEHLESRIRLQAVLDVAKEHGITIGEDNIVYAEWSAAPARDAVKSWIQENGMPDAIICANDIMAEGVCHWLQDNHYSVPEDVIVTGFDNIRVARECQPVITSVSRGWDDMGYNALKSLLDRIAGKETNPHMVMNTHLVHGGSCGCCPNQEKEGAGSATRIPAERHIDGYESDQHFRHLYRTIRKVETIDELHWGLSYFFEHENRLEGESFMLCLHPQFFLVDENDDVFKGQEFSRHHDVVCTLTNGKAEGRQRMETKQALFYTAEHSEKPGCYIYVAVRSDNQSFGFAMLGRNLDISDNNILYIWTRHMNQYMEQIRANVKIAELTRRLAELSVTDILTGVLNRRGCEKQIYSFLEQCQKDGGRGIVMIADVDKMKTINDKYGHTQGDLALRVVSDILKTELPEGFMVARFGGDEFFIGGKSDGETSLEAIIEHVMDRLAEEVERRKIPFRLTVSIGGTVLEEGEEFRLESCLPKADENMYKRKKMHHRQLHK